MQYIENTKHSESGKYNHGDICQTYSLAYLFDKDYDEVFKELVNGPFDLKTNATVYCTTSNKYRMTVKPDDLIHNYKRLTVGQLAKLFKDINIKVAVFTHKHLTVIDNGNIVDKLDCSRRYVNYIFLTKKDYKHITHLLRK